MRVQIDALVEMFHIVFDNHAEEKIMTTQEVAGFINVDVEELYAMCADGRVPFRKRGRRYQFRKSEIIKWMKNQDSSSPFSVDGYVEKYLMQNKLKG